MNRTEALDLSRAVIRDGERVLPRRTPVVEEFASHVAANSKRLIEKEDTGEQRYQYIRTGADHLSLALTYDCLAAMRDGAGGVTLGIVPLSSVPAWNLGS